MQHTSPRLFTLPIVMSHPASFTPLRGVLEGENADESVADSFRQPMPSTTQYQFVGGARCLLAERLDLHAVFTPGEAPETETSA